MTQPTTTHDAVKQAALGPKKVKVANQEVEQHPLPDLVEADRHDKSRTAAARDHLGIRFRKIVPPGAG